MMTLGEPRLMWALSHLSPSDDVLDLGCHKGEMTSYLWGFTIGRVVGVDIALSSIKGARAYHRGVEIDWLVSDAEALPLADSQFDLGVIAELLEHVVNPDAVIKEAERVARPGGKIVISTPRDAVLMDMSGRFSAEREGALPFDAHVREYVPEIELAGKPGLVTDTDATGLGLRWHLAAYRVEKSLPPKTSETRGNEMCLQA